MLIRVMYRDGSQDRVNRAQLKLLIEHDQIRMFKRFSGWVSVVCDRTREKTGATGVAYSGQERRCKEAKKSYIFLDEPLDL